MTLKQIFNTSAELDYPTVLPTLDLDFANTKTLDPRITFTRASSGSYFGADGILKYAGVNEARFDHNPLTGESLGLLVEEQRTNIFTRGDIEGTVGTKPIGMIGLLPVVSTDVFVGSNQISAKHTRGNDPDSNVGYFGFGSHTLNIPYTASVYVYIPSSQSANFSGKSIAVSAEGGGANAIAFANTSIFDRWQRLVITYTLTTGTGASIVLRTNASSESFFYSDCWQLEQGPFSTSYIPSSNGSQFTRSADNPQITGTNFSSWYNQSEGTVSIGCITRRPAGFNSADFAITNSFTTTYTSRIVGWFNIGLSPYISVFANNINIFLPYIGTPANSTNIPIKKAIALATRNMRVATNGTIITGNLGNTTVPNYLPNDFNRLLIGYEGIFAGYLNGTISRLTYYPKALPNSQLITLTAV
jgi:hypothetical protein